MWCGQGNSVEIFAAGGGCEAELIHQAGTTYCLDGFHQVGVFLALLRPTHTC